MYKICLKENSIRMKKYKKQFESEKNENKQKKLRKDLEIAEKNLENLNLKIKDYEERNL